jgi:hypothetical protein
MVPALSADKDSPELGRACWCAAGILPQAVGTLLQHTKRKSAGWLTLVSSPADLSCPSWARTRTLLIQRGHQKPRNSSNLQSFTRVRVARCWSLLVFMPYFAVLYSLKCQVGPPRKNTPRKPARPDDLEPARWSDCPSWRHAPLQLRPFRQIAVRPRLIQRSEPVTTKAEAVVVKSLKNITVTAT